jgi:GH25 family lysozyme M1 (1,4-beta-N-acetylmuramidase)
MNYSYAIDISKWQGSWVDPDKTVASGIDFMYLRGLNGTRRDTRIDEYALICRARGINFGVYQFYRPAQSPELQAKALFDLSVEVGANMVPQLDIEHSDGMDRDAVSRSVARYIKAVEALFGTKAVIYSAAWWWDPMIDNNIVDVSKHFKWVARYVTMKSGPDSNVKSWMPWAQKFNKHPRVPQGWGDWDLWQFSADGNSKGQDLGFSSSHLDLNVGKPGVFEHMLTGPYQPIQKPSVPVLSRGARGNEVRNMQRALHKAGRNPGPLDGVFGYMTEAAVKLFQRDAELDVTGIYDEETRQALENWKPSDNGLAAARRRVLRRGSSGAEVVVLQTLLQARGFYRAAIDGRFGPVTEQAVRGFQRQAGIVVDGWVGPQTWGAFDGS